jgi:hypothetical protein
MHVTKGLPARTLEQKTSGEKSHGRRVEGAIEYQIRRTSRGVTIHKFSSDYRLASFSAIFRYRPVRPKLCAIGAFVRDELLRDFGERAAVIFYRWRRKARK